MEKQFVVLSSINESKIQTLIVLFCVTSIQEKTVDTFISVISKTASIFLCGAVTQDHTNCQQQNDVVRCCLKWHKNNIYCLQCTAADQTFIKGSNGNG